MLTAAERRLKVLLRILSFIFGLAIFGYLIPALTGPLQAFFVNLPFVTNSVVKIALMALLAFFASADVRRYRLLVLVVIAGHVVSEIATGAVLIWGKTDYNVNLAGNVTPVTTLLWGSMVLDGIILVLLIWFLAAADRARYALLYFSPLQFRVLTALADVVVAGKDELVPPQDVARNVDGYLARFDSKTKWIMKAVLIGIQIYPLLSLKPPFSYLSAEDRTRFLRKRFYRDVTRRLVPEFWRTIVQGMIRMGNQLSYIGYYNDPRTFESVGYVPFSQRTDTPDRLLKNPPPPRTPLKVYTPADISAQTLEGDVVIIGSGAGASIMAHGVIKAGRSVLMLERGDYVDPVKFSEDEVEMLTKLYSDGALQLTRDFRFQVLQGSCVGGTTVVNNAVCFDLPEQVLNKWNDAQSFDAGLDPSMLAQSFREVRDLIRVERQDHSNLNKGARFFNEGLARLGLHQPPNITGPVDANIQGCLGCGYCNIGCKFGRKLSMLDSVLPMIQREYNGREALRIIAGCEAEKIRGRGREITSIVCRLKDGRRIEVKGNTFVVAAGTISSSLLLMNSSIGGDRAGKNVSFNMGSPITAVFDRVVNSYDGLQISHFLELSPSRGYVIETWFNPPVAQALTMPGWFEDHYNNMLRYNRITCAGVLVGTASNAEVRRAGLTGREIDYVPTREDLDKLIDGLVLSGEVFFEAGATTIIPNTFDYHEFKTPEELRGLRALVKDPSDITLGTGHPQGGNAIAGNRKLGVIDPEFRVYGYDNLFVADASVFPTSLGVNPQLTVMAMANYAARFVAK